MSVYPEGVEVQMHADLSDCGTYRYWLSRAWGRSPVGGHRSLAFIMLNPSTADAEQDDPTIRKCVGFARRFGYDAISIFNLYALRATDPKVLLRALRAGEDAVGPDNDERLRTLLAARLSVGAPVVAAWGAHAPDSRVRQVLDMPGARALHSLALTARGVPRHPLMLGYEGAVLRPLVDGGDHA